jgi:ABC-2 type transport system permease protein
MFAAILDDLRLWLRLLGISARARMQYRLDLVFQVIGVAIINLGDFLAVWVLIAACGPNLGWNLPEAAVLYGVVATAFALVQFFNAGLERCHDLVRRGDIDIHLLRPRPVLLLVAGQDLPVRQIGRLAQAVAVLAWGLWSCPVDAGGALLLVWALVWGMVLYLAFDLLRGASAFWTVEGAEVWNVLTYGGSMAATWPAEAYRPLLRTVMLTVVPVAAVGWLPVAAALGKDHGLAVWAPWVAPLAALPIAILAMAAWSAGLRRYGSTGS